MNTVKKITVAILFGGKSAEHEVSLQSAKNVIYAIDKARYDVVPIGIDKSGKWLLHKGSHFLLNQDDPNAIQLNPANCEHVALVPQSNGLLLSLSSYAPICKVDVVFPLLHGPFGEDGTVQGLLKLAGVPFVGPGVLGSAIGMDKDVTKRLLRDAGIPIGKFLTFYCGDHINTEAVFSDLGSPVFVKPANLGSSVGISKAMNKSELELAIKLAFKYDRKILIESFIEGREIECAVLGNDNPIASIVGEIKPHHDFYSYEAKYLDKQGATSQVPAEIDGAISSQVRVMAIQAFKVLCCEGLSRVDFFLKKDGSILISEINTIPGFTNISMYPRLWQESGIGYSNLISQLIELAVDRFAQENKSEEVADTFDNEQEYAACISK